MSKQLVLAWTLSNSLTALAYAQGVPTNGMLDTPIGKLEVNNGYPTEATTKKLFDEMDFQRAVQAYIWALPMIGSAQWQNEQHASSAPANSTTSIISTSGTSSGC